MSKQTLGIVLALVSAVGFILLWTDVLVFPFAGWVYGIGITLACFLVNSGEKEDAAKKLAKKENTLSPEERVLMNRFRNLLYVAYADEEVKKEEALMCIALARNFGLNESLVAPIADSFEYQNWNIYKPQTQQELNVHVNELFAVSMVDGKVQKKEKARIAELLVKIGATTSSNVDDFIEESVEKLKANDDFQAMLKNLKALAKKA